MFLQVWYILHEFAQSTLLFWLVRWILLHNDLSTGDKSSLFCHACTGCCLEYPNACSLQYHACTLHTGYIFLHLVQHWIPLRGSLWNFGGLYPFFLPPFRLRGIGWLALAFTALSFPDPFLGELMVPTAAADWFNQILCLLRVGFKGHLIVFQHLWVRWQTIWLLFGIIHVHKCVWQGAED